MTETAIAGRKKHPGNRNAKAPQQRGQMHRVSAWPSTPIYEWAREKLRAAGQDPEQLPIPAPHLMRLPQVMVITGLKAATVYAWAAAGKFPRPIPL